MRANLGGTYTSPNLADAASADTDQKTSAIDRFLAASSDASRLLAQAQQAGLPAPAIDVLRTMVLQRIVAAFEQYAKQVVAAVLSETGQFDSSIGEKQVGLKYILDHGLEGIGLALLEREVLGSVETFGTLFNYVAPKAVTLNGSTGDLLSDILQIRHTIVHHLGSVTKSDARKFRTSRLQRAHRIQIDEALLRDISAFLEWLVRVANDGLCSATVAQHFRAGLLTGSYQNDKQLFYRLMAIFYCSQDHQHRMTSVLPRLYRNYRPRRR